MYSTSEAAQKAGINENTLKKWLKDFNIEVPKNKLGYREFQDIHIEQVINIKNLRDNDNGINTINRIIHPNQDPKQEKKQSDIPLIYRENQNDTELIKKLDTIEKSIDSIAELSEKYSRATYQIGKLEERNLSLSEKLDLIKSSDEAERKALHSELSRIESQYIADIQRLKAEYTDIIKAKENEIQRLKSELEIERNKTLIQKVFRK